MTARIVGMVDLQRVLADLPERLERNVLRGAMKAGAEVIADAARDNCRSSEVRDSITTSASVKGRIVTSVVQTKGEGAYIAPWLEYGTDPHIISVADDRDRQGMSIRRINDQAKKGTLVIGGKPVGAIVHHPGAGSRPFMRPALDQHGDDAVTVIGEQIAARLAKVGDAVLPDGPTE